MYCSSAISPAPRMTSSSAHRQPSPQTRPKPSVRCTRRASSTSPGSTPPTAHPLTGEHCNTCSAARDQPHRRHRRLPRTDAECAAARHDLQPSRRMIGDSHDHGSPRQQPAGRTAIDAMILVGVLGFVCHRTHQEVRVAHRTERSTTTSTNPVADFQTTLTTSTGGCSPHAASPSPYRSCSTSSPPSR